MRKLIYFLLVLIAVCVILLRPVSEDNVSADTKLASARVTPIATPTPVPTPTPTPTPEPTPTPTPTPTPLMISVNAMYNGLSDSSDNNEIARLQNRLDEMGYYTGDIDGIFGDTTEDAVKYFQSANGLEVTGVADAITIYAIYSDDAVINPEPSPTPFTNGVTGDEVVALQERLRLLGFMSGDADGSFGAKTENAIIRAKEYLHSKEEITVESTVTPVPTPTQAWVTPSATPYVTPESVLDSSIGAYVDQPTPSPTPTIRFTPTPAPWTADGVVTDELIAQLNDDNFDYYDHDVAKGDETNETLRVQNRLVILGYLKKADGQFGSNTERALKYFQYKNGLTETGIADLTTQSRLFSVDAVESDVIVTLYKLTVSTSKQRVYVYQWNGYGFDTSPLKTFKCSTGKNGAETETPKGEYWNGRPVAGRWYYFKEFDCYAQYAWVINGGVMFHSVLYSKADEKTLRYGSVKALGTKASHGCVRLAVDDAKWIWENCVAGTPVTVE